MSGGNRLNNVFATNDSGYARAWPHLMRRVAQALIIIATASLVAAAPTGCYAQDRATEQEKSRTEREDWQARVKASRERIELMRRERRSFLPPTTDEIAEAASTSVLEDDTLLPGDIVSTTRGLFRFRGSPNRDRRLEDFERVR